MSTPRTWVVGEVVTASELNTEVRDQWNNEALTGSSYITGGDVTVTSSDTVLAVIAASIVNGKKYLIEVSGTGTTTQTASSAQVWIRHRTTLWAVGDTDMTGSTTIDSRIIQFGATSNAQQYHLIGEYTAAATQTRYVALVGNRNGGTGQITFSGNSNNARCLRVWPIGP